MFTHFAASLFLDSNAEGKHLGGKAWAQFAGCASLSRYLFAWVALLSQRPPEKLSWRPFWKIPVACSCFTEAVVCRQPLAEAWASRESVTSQEPHEGKSFSLPGICSSYTVSTGLCSPQVPLKKISTSWRVRLFIIWKELS